MRKIIRFGESYMNDNVQKTGNCEMDEICIGLENGLTKEQVLVYTGKSFNFKQMREIRLGFESGLSMEQVLIYADNKYTWLQMSEIRSGFVNGLTENQVLIYADESYKSYYMGQLRKWFEYGLTIEQIKTFDIEGLDSEQKDEVAGLFSNNCPIAEIEKRIKSLLTYNARSKMINKIIRQYGVGNAVLTKEKLDEILEETEVSYTVNQKTKCR